MELFCLYTVSIRATAASQTGAAVRSKYLWNDVIIRELLKWDHKQYVSSLAKADSCGVTTILDMASDLHNQNKAISATGLGGPEL
jgi:hypothetical protein